MSASPHGHVPAAADLEAVQRDAATVICPRYPLALDGLDFGPGAPRRLPGGICVFAVDLPGSLLELAALKQRVGDDAPYVCSDLERGAGQQVAGLTRLPCAMAIGAAHDEDLAFAAGRLTGEEAAAAGIAIVFAPVVDVADEPRNPIVATRAFSADPDEVARFAAAFARGLATTRVAATAKHFPGHGATTEDSHLELPLLRRDREALSRVELVPFRRLIADGVPAVMIGHLHAIACDGAAAVPTSLSTAAITGLLRNELGFAGVVVTDALDMGAIDDGQALADPAQEPAVRAIAAGADVALLPRDPSRAARALVNAVALGSLPRQRLAEAAGRIRTLLSGCAPSPAAVPRLTPQRSDAAEIASRVARAALTLLPAGAALPPLAGRTLALTAIDDGKGELALPRLRAALARRGIDVSEFTPGSTPSPGAPVVAAVFSDVRCNKGRVQLDEPRAAALRAVLAAAPQTVIAVLGCPQALAGMDLGSAPRLYAYDDDEASVDAVAAALAAELKPAGVPVFLPREERA
jgi:beta-N-acetylhexosaminidase